MIRAYIKEQQIKKLWKAAFNDDDAFIRFYFKHIYKDGNALTLEHDGRIVSSLQLLPYTMNYFGREIPVVYISGACTDEKERGKGLMKTLMNRAFDEIRKRGAALAFLIPAGSELFSYYAGFGFTRAFEYSVGLYNRPAYSTHVHPGYTVKCERQVKEETWDYFDRSLRSRPISILHDCRDLSNIIRDMKITNGRLFVARNAASRIGGMAFAVPSGRLSEDGLSVTVKELLYDDEDSGRALLNHINDYYGVSRLMYRTPCSSSLRQYSYGMARVTDAERLVDLWVEDHPECSLVRNELLGMEVGSLTSLLLDYPNRAAYMSLMLD
jgi:GNAT superfamily N-acetyltransferase